MSGTGTYTKPILQIVPSLPPEIDGIGDHALQLARQLRDRHRVETSFIVCDPGWRRNLWSREFPAIGLNERTSSAMLEALDIVGRKAADAPVPVLLHFSPYGYQRRGVPFWLIRALESFARQTPGGVNVAFHELDVECSRVWSSAFWVPSLQRHLMRRMLRMGGFQYTNTEHHRQKLETWGSQALQIIPNFSNMGELELPPPAQGRAREVVIFGRADQRRWSYQYGAEALRAVCEHIGATRIVDIGPPIPEHTCRTIHGVPVLRRGVLPAEELTHAMRCGLASFMYYPVSLLTKSGVHALSCASGTLPFVFDDKKLQVACCGLTEGVDFITVKPDVPLPPMELLESLSPVIYESYCKRSSKVAAHMVAANILNEASAA